AAVAHVFADREPLLFFVSPVDRQLRVFAVDVFDFAFGSARPVFRERANLRGNRGGGNAGGVFAPVLLAGALRRVCVAIRNRASGSVVGLVSAEADSGRTEAADDRFETAFAGSAADLFQTEPLPAV